MKLRNIIVFMSCVILVTGCTSDKDTTPSNEDKIKSTVTCSEAENMVASESTILIDVRTSEEYEEGHLDDAINLEYSTITDTIEDVVSDKDTIIIVYCKSGTRSNIAYESLVAAGYTNVYDLGAMGNCD